MPIRFATPLSNFTDDLTTSGLNISANTDVKKYELENFFVTLNIIGQKDNSYLDLFEQLKIRTYTHPTISGLSDLDYPTQTNGNQTFLNIPQISNLKIKLLPPEIVEIINKTGYSTNLGLLPIINRAFFIADNSFYLWNYENDSDLLTYDGIDEPIITASLFSPKPGYFKSFIQHILCLISANNIIILALSLSKESFDNQAKNANFNNQFPLQIQPEPIASIPSDGHIFLDIKSAKNNGKVYLAGEDGCLYELHYQPHKNWLGKKAWLINHSRGKLSSLILPGLRGIFGKPDPLVQIAIDETRNNLYTLSGNGNIQLFYLGLDANETTYITSSSDLETHNRAVAITKLVERDNFGKIISLAPIIKTESKNIHLVATTSSGFRYYFSTKSPEDEDNIPPYMLKLIHLRFPPGYSASTVSSQRPKNVVKALHSGGTTALLSSPTELTDLLWLCNSDNFPFSPYFMEAQSTATIDGKTWAFKEANSEQGGQVPPFAPTININADGLSNGSDSVFHYKQRVKEHFFNASSPEVINEIYDGPRKFALLTAQKCFTFEMLQPSNFLKTLLLINNGPDCPQVAQYLSSLGTPGQALATCIHLASCLGAAEQQILEWTIQALVIYGNWDSVKNKRTSPPAIKLGAQGTPSSILFGQQGGPSSYMNSPGQQAAPFSSTPQHGLQNGKVRPGLTPLLLNRTQAGRGTPGTTFNFNSTPAQRLFEAQLDRSQSRSDIPVSERFLQRGDPWNRGPTTQSEYTIPPYDVPQIVEENSPTPYPIPLSPIQEGLLHYFWRIVRPVWNVPVAFSISDVNSAKDGSNAVISSNITQPDSPRNSFLSLLYGPNDFSCLAARLQGLENFCKANPSLLTSQHATPPIGTPTNLSSSRAMDISPASNPGSARFKRKNLSGSQYFTTPDKDVGTAKDFGTSFSEKLIWLVTRTKELALLFKILSEHDLPRIFSTLPPDDAQELVDSSFYTILISTSCGETKPQQTASLNQSSLSFNTMPTSISSTLIAHIITAAINHYLTDQSLGPMASDILVKRLQESCPSFYGPDEALIAKANEYLVSASRMNYSRLDAYYHNPMEKSQVLEKALQMFLKVADKLNLKSVSAHFCNLGDYEAVVELCLEAARLKDPTNRSLGYYRTQKGIKPADHQPKNTGSGSSPGPDKKAFDLRLKYYEIILDALKELQAQAFNVQFDAQSFDAYNRMEAIGGQSIDEQDLPLALKMNNKLSNVLALCTRSTDELFHYLFYDWLLENGLSDYLIKIKSPYLEDYLNRLTASQNLQSVADVSTALELKCKYYNHNKDPSSMAKVLITLAERYDPGITLNERVDHLSSALTYAGSNKAGQNAGNTEWKLFVQELEDKVEVAKIQLQIMGCIEMHYGDTDRGKQAFVKLNSELFDLTRLYEEFAEPFELWECQLAIIYSARHSDAQMVKNIWANILDTEQPKCQKATTLGAGPQSSTRGPYPNLIASAMANKILGLGKIYAATEAFFPIKFLIEIMEKKSFELGYSSILLFDVLLKLNYDIGKVLDIYEEILNSSTQNPFYYLHLSTVILGMTEFIANNRELISLAKKRRLSNQCLHLLSSMAIQIQSRIPYSVLEQNGTPDILDRISATQNHFQNCLAK